MKKNHHSEREKIVRSIESNRKELVRLCSDLIRVRSDNPPGDCSEIISVLKEEYDEFGVRLLTASAPRNWLRSKGLDYPRDNFLVCIGGMKKVGLSIGTHMDTVSAGKREAWRYPPFSGTVANNKIWGRGACDAKCSLTAQVYAAKALLESEVSMDESLLMLGTVDDEAPKDSTWPGMEYMVKHGIRDLGFSPPKLAINAEASGLENIWGIFNGSVAIEAKFKGRVGHPPVGVNALENAAVFWNKIVSLGKSRGVIASPVWLSGGSRSDFGLTPEAAEMIFKISMGPKKNPSELIRAIERLVTNNLDVKIRMLSSQVPFDTRKDGGELVSVIERNAREAGVKSKYGGGIVGAGDLYFFLEKGIPGVTYGAGSLDRCHVPNEFVSIDELVDQAKIYALTALDICTV